MIHPNAPLTLAGKLTVRTVLLIDPDNKIVCSSSLDLSISRCPFVPPSEEAQPKAHDPHVPGHNGTQLFRDPARA